MAGAAQSQNRQGPELSVQEKKVLPGLLLPLKPLLWPRSATRSLWPSNPEAFGDGVGGLLSFPLEKGQSQARGVSPGTRVVVRLSRKVGKARFWLAVSAEGIRFGGRW